MKTLLIKILIAPLIFFGIVEPRVEAPLPTPTAIERPAELGVVTLPINGSTYNLSGSGVTSSATSFTLSSLTIPQNGYKIVDADASATFYMTLEPGSRTRQEVVACTTITQNVAGTATISGCTRGLSPISPYTASTSLRFAHPGGSQVIFGDAAQLFNEYGALGNDNTWTAANVFSTSPTLTTQCSVGSVNAALCDKAYIDGVAVAGASNGNDTTKGIFESATAIEQASSTSAGATAALLVTRALYATSSPVTGCNGTATAGALCSVIARNDGKIHPNFIATSSTDAYNFGGTMTYAGTETHSGTETHTGLTSFSATTTMATTTQTGAGFGSNIVNNYTGGEAITGATTPQPVMIATTTARVSLIDSNVASTSGPLLGFVINNCSNGTTCYVQTDGIVKGFTGLTIGAEYYVSDTAGTLSTTIGSSENYVGRAISASQIEIDKNRPMQYLGSQGLSTSATTVINQPFARFAIIVADITSGCDSSPHTLTIARYGVVAGTASEQCSTSGADDGNRTTYTWTGGGIVNALGGNASGQSATAYYYK